MRTVVAAGAVVMGYCEENITGVCQCKPEVVSPVLVYHDALSKQEIHACRACANHRYLSKEWVRPGEEGSTADRNIVTYIWKMRRAGSDEEKKAVIKEFRDQRWPVQLPFAAGDIADGIWVSDIMFSGLGWVRIAILGDDYTTPAVAEVRPPRDFDEYLRCHGAFFIVERYLS